MILHGHQQISSSTRIFCKCAWHYGQQTSGRGLFCDAKYLCTVSLHHGLVKRKMYKMLTLLACRIFPFPRSAKLYNAI